MLKASYSVHTDLFETQTPKGYFLRPDLFGDDFAWWLHDRLKGLEAWEMTLGDPGQTEFGWSFSLDWRVDRYWVSCTWIANDETSGLAHWVVDLSPEERLNLGAGLLHKPARWAYDEIRKALRAAIDAEPLMTLDISPDTK